MSELIFVRHGQASFGEESYDKLSALGVRQASTLGKHWRDMGEQFDHIYAGTLLRQKETAKQLISLVKGSPSYPNFKDAFNEYSGDSLLRIYMRDYLKHDKTEAASDWPIKDERVFQNLFELATAKWIKNELTPSTEDADYESWETFKNRVYGVIDEIMEKHTSGSRVLISTSGGVIAMALQKVLNFSDEHVISTNWMIHNSSVTRVRYGNDKVSLTQFNSLPHLEMKGMKHLITYR
ncbi:MAG: histidine phosphatase family protein [Gammaproteobacteria bacterium]|nr:histidine phosphatase family protein [Gammaproteobacteria bacterium]